MSTGITSGRGFPISVTLITLNEENRLPQALRSVAWADDRVVIDCGSTDRTVEIAQSLGARVIVNPWPGYGAQKNFAQSQAKHDWVLNIDADEVVPPELAAEIQSRLESLGLGPAKTRGFAVPRRTFYLGRWIQHGGWYPNHLVRLADRRFAKWTEPALHESLKVDGTVETLVPDLLHYSFDGLEDQVRANLRYAREGSRTLLDRGKRPSLVKLFIKPIGKFLETYVAKQGFRDGLPGLIISINAAYSMFLKYAFLFEPKLHPKT